MEQAIIQSGIMHGFLTYFFSASMGINCPGRETWEEECYVVRVGSETNIILVTFNFKGLFYASVQSVRGI
jgi:hypothetical protein